MSFVEGRVAPAVGLLTTLSVLWLLVFVPFFAKPVIPQESSWGESPEESSLEGIYVVTSRRPSQLTDAAIRLAVRYVESETGWRIQRIEYGPYPNTICASFDAEESASAPAVPCKSGWVLVLQDDRLLLGSSGRETESFGRTFLGDRNRDGVPDFPIEWATVVLTDGPLELDFDPAFREDAASRLSTPPPNAYANLFTHELLHALGYGHTYTPVLPGCNALVMERSGSILNPSFFRSGWDGTGLDKWDSKRRKDYEREVLP